MLDERLDFRCGRFNGVAENEQLAGTFALLLLKLRRPRLGVFQRCEERLFRGGHRAGKHERHALDALACRKHAYSATQTVAHDGLGS